MKEIKGLKSCRSSSKLPAKSMVEGITLAQRLELLGNVISTAKDLYNVASNERIRMAEFNTQLKAIEADSMAKVRCAEEKTKQVIANARIEYERIQAESFLRGKELDNAFSAEQNRHNEVMAQMEKADSEIQKILDSILEQVAEYRKALNDWLEMNKGVEGVDFTPCNTWMMYIGKFYEQTSDLTKAFINKEYAPGGK